MDECCSCGIRLPKSYLEHYACSKCGKHMCRKCGDP